jgi:2-iminobutanoate/2-iminopropanoate deaminase
VTESAELPDLAPAFTAAFGEDALPPQGVSLVPRLPGGIKVEITVVASRRDGDRTAVGRASDASQPAQGLVAGGMLSTRTETAPEAGDDVEAQVRAVATRLLETVRAAGFSPRDLVHLQVGLADLADLGRVDAPLAEALADAPPPPRTVVQLVMPSGTRVQMHAVAVR